MVVRRPPRLRTLAIWLLGLAVVAMAVWTVFRFRNERDDARQELREAQALPPPAISGPAAFAGPAQRAFFRLTDGGSLGVVVVEQPNGQRLHWITLHMTDVSPDTEFQVEAGRCLDGTSESLAAFASPVSSSSGSIELVQPNLQLDEGEIYWMRVRGPNGEDFGGVRGPFFESDAAELSPGEPPC